MASCSKGRPCWLISCRWLVSHVSDNFLPLSFIFKCVFEGRAMFSLSRISSSWQSSWRRPLAAEKRRRRGRELTLEEKKRPRRRRETNVGRSISTGGLARVVNNCSDNDNVDNIFAQELQTNNCSTILSWKWHLTFGTKDRWSWTQLVSH